MLDTTSQRHSITGRGVAALVVTAGLGAFAWHEFAPAPEVDPGMLATLPVPQKPGREKVKSSGEAFVPKVYDSPTGETVLSFSLINPDSTDVFCPPGLPVVMNLGVLSPGLKTLLVERAKEKSSFGRCTVTGDLVNDGQGPLFLSASEIEWKR